MAPFASRRVARIAATLFGMALGLAAAAADAQITVSNAWIRGTVPNQQASGAFMDVTSATAARLVAARSDVAEVTEIHQMSMDNGVMKMAPVAGVDLPAGKAVQLKPGSYHVMMMGLKRQLKAGDTVPITLVVEQPGGKREDVTIQVAVRPLNAPAGAAPAEGMPGGAMSGGAMNHTH